MQNCPQYIISHYAVQYIGAIVCPLNPMYKEKELEYLIEEAGIRAICCTEELLPVVRSLSSYLDWTLVAHYADYLPEQTEFLLPKELKANKCKKEIEKQHGRTWKKSTYRQSSRQKLILTKILL